MDAVRGGGTVVGYHCGRSGHRASAVRPPARPSVRLSVLIGGWLDIWPMAASVTQVRGEYSGHLNGLDKVAGPFSAAPPRSPRPLPPHTTPPSAPPP